MSRYSFLLVTCATVLITAPAVAQNADIQAATTVVETLPPATTATPNVGPEASRSVGPTVSSGIVGVNATSERPLHPAPVAQQRVGRNPALMIVGGVAIVIGGIIGGDSGTILMVGGAVAGLVGLWRFLQ